MCDLETSRMGAPYIYDISRLRVNDRSTGTCTCLRLHLYMPHVSLLCFYAYRLYLTCDMDKSNLRHIHDPVLLSLKIEVICYINFLAYQELKLTFHSNNNQVYILL